jgi:hypothetical protein
LRNFLKEYRGAVHGQWTEDYYGWLKDNVQAEIWAVAAGVVAPAGATLVAYFFWPDTLPVSLSKAVGIAAFLGAVGGSAALLLLLLITSAKHRFLAPHKVWVADQSKIATLQATISELEGTKQSLAADRQKLTEQLEEERLEVAKLRQNNDDLDKDRQQLRAELNVRRQLELFPTRIEEYDSISVLSAKISYSEAEHPDIEITAVWGTLTNVVIVNNDEHPTTISRLWLRVCDPVTGEEIKPLTREELGKIPSEELMGPMEEFEPRSAIEARGQVRGKLEFRRHYPGRFLRLTREEKARMITLCATASGLGTTCCALGKEFFFDETAPRRQRRAPVQEDTEADEQDV